jgi:hypothetical protein
MKVLKLTKMVLMNCWTYLVQVVFGCFSAMITTFGLNYSLVNFLLFGISWPTIWSVWGYMCCKVAYYFPGYFFIICYHLKFRLSSIDKRLKNFMKYSNHFSLVSKITIMRRLLREHNNLCKQIHDYNEFWKKYLTLAYVIAVSAVCFLSYVVFLSQVKWFPRLVYIVVLVSHIQLLAIITYSASNVSQFNEIIFRDLYSIYVRNHFPTSFKLKVYNK